MKTLDKYECVRKTISIPILITNVSDEVKREFFFKNINRYRFLKNDCVELANLYCGDYNLYEDISMYKLHSYYFNFVEIYDKDYNDFCVNMSECVFEDIESAIRNIRKRNRDILNGKLKGQSLGKLNFKKRDNYYGAFKIKPKMSTKIDKSGELKQRGRIKIIDNSTIRFTVSSGKGRGSGPTYIIFDLNEPLFDRCICDKNEPVTYIKNMASHNECWFNLNDIKYVSFIHKLDKFYIQFAISVEIFTEKTIKKPKAGIDLGIHNPGILYDGDNVFRIAMPDNIISKILYLERRCGRYQHRMDIKYFTNKKLVQKGLLKSPYSKNYEKIRKKYRRIENKIHNIKMDWIYKTTKLIVTNYKVIIVDKSSVPIMDDIPRVVAKKIQHKINLQAIGIFNVILKHMASKYGSMYIEAPEGTTCTCSNCGHINKPIPLKVRTFVCDKCGLKLDRDINASKNCYDSYSG